MRGRGRHVSAVLGAERGGTSRLECGEVAGVHHAASEVDVLIIETREWPSWSAIMRALAPLPSSRVATVLRKVCVLTHSKSERSRT